jgi:predicted N-formylglutamate amidohydrolase
MRVGALLLTCEHGGNRVPREFALLFAGAKARRALKGHRGYDIGALPVARALARELRVELLYSTTTRLLIEPNRSVGHAQLFSEFSRTLDPDARGFVVERHYTPHRERVVAAVETRSSNCGLVCHIGVHSFVPVLHGVTRSADIGLLYDPARRYESAICATWKQALARCDAGLRVRRNYPYRGTADGLTTALRRRYPAERYVGIELEMNQRLLAGGSSACRRVIRAIRTSLSEVLQAQF